MVGVGFAWVWVRGGLPYDTVPCGSPNWGAEPAFKPINVVFKIIPQLKNGPFKEAKKASKKLYM